MSRDTKTEGAKEDDEVVNISAQLFMFGSGFFYKLIKSRVFNDAKCWKRELTLTC